ncbi:hypothetical protein ALIPUT_00680 [Alistipes putredinis DSM 17216]|uniref:Uncharacterized protein n=1 Tax=Alistipes putredinis DSM 17216 TaxID=445970 RepID=B0MSP4_9BACT|nr:hypothetical protein ALIPUT_00680 [Alistipes putredinis DSM 17216]
MQKFLEHETKILFFCRIYRTRSEKKCVRTQWENFVIRKRGASSDSAKGCVGVLRSSGMTPCMEKAKPRQRKL